MMCGVRKYLDNRFFLEYGDAQNLENCVEAQIQIQPLLDDGYQDVDRDGDPHLRLHGVLRGSEERLDPKMLLDPPEEELSGKGLARCLSLLLGPFPAPPHR